MKSEYFVKSSDKLLAGVCSGFANYFELNKNALRAVALVLFYFFSLEILSLYLLICLLSLSEPKCSHNQRKFYKRLERNSKINFCKYQSGIFLGVCKGLAIRFNLNLFGVRLLFLVTLLFFGFGAAIYILLALLMPSKSDFEVELILKIKTLRDKAGIPKQY